jgi:hypothetical protein
MSKFIAAWGIMQAYDEKQLRENPSPGYKEIGIALLKDCFPHRSDQVSSIDNNYERRSLFRKPME